jgi:hypothetical protein
MPERRKYSELGPGAKARVLARRKLNLYVYYGKVKRRPCEVCGATDGIEAHHEDYSKPLDVNWLCPTHHKEADAAKRRRDEGDAMSRIKPSEVTQAQRFSTGIERVGEDLIARYREVEAQRADAPGCGAPVRDAWSGGCIRNLGHSGPHQGHCRYVAFPDERVLPERTCEGLATDMRSEIDRAFDAALGGGRR